jgi:hypothetical protein
MPTRLGNRQAGTGALVVVVVLLLVVLGLAAARRPSSVKERLQVTDTTVALSPQWGCAVRDIPWRIKGYASSDYQIVWTVSRLNGPPWVWHHVTEAALDHDNLRVELCDWIVEPGTTHFSVSGVIELVNMAKRTGGKSPPGRASLTVQVPAA